MSEVFGFCHVLLEQKFSHTNPRFRLLPRPTPKSQIENEPVNGFTGKNSVVDSVVNLAKKSGEKIISLKMGCPVTLYIHCKNISKVSFVSAFPIFQHYILRNAGRNRLQ